MSDRQHSHARRERSLPTGYRFGDGRFGGYASLTDGAADCPECGMQMWLGGATPECVSPYCHPEKTRPWSQLQEWERH